MAGRGIRFLRGLAITVLSGVIAGGVVGTGARLAMRAVALNDETPGTLFTVGGTLGILLVVIVFGIPFVGLFVAVRHALPGGTLRKGLLFGAGMAVFPGLPFVLGEAFEVGRPWMNLPMFVGLFLAYGVSVATTVGWLDGRLPGPAQPEAADQADSSRSGPNTALGM